MKNLEETMKFMQDRFWIKLIVYYAVTILSLCVPCILIGLLVPPSLAMLMIPLLIIMVVVWLMNLERMMLLSGKTVDKVFAIIRKETKTKS